MRNKDHQFPQAQFANNSALAATCRIKTYSLAFFMCSIPSILCSTYKTFHGTCPGPNSSHLPPLGPFPIDGGVAAAAKPSLWSGYRNCCWERDAPSIFSVSQSQLSWPTQLGSNGRRSRKKGEEQRQEHLCKRQQEFDTSNICQ